MKNQNGDRCARFIAGAIAQLTGNDTYRQKLIHVEKVTPMMSEGDERKRRTSSVTQVLWAKAAVAMASVAAKSADRSWRTVMVNFGIIQMSETALLTCSYNQARTSCVTRSGLTPASAAPADRRRLHAMVGLSIRLKMPYRQFDLLVSSHARPDQSGARLRSP